MKNLEDAAYDGHRLIRIKTDVKAISEEGISFTLPEICYELGHRKVKRHACKGIQVDFIQNGALFRGHLLDFNPASFCVEVSAAPPQTFYWINPEYQVHTILKNEQDVHLLERLAFMHRRESR